MRTKTCLVSIVLNKHQYRCQCSASYQSASIMDEEQKNTGEIVKLLAGNSDVPIDVSIEIAVQMRIVKNMLEGLSHNLLAY